MFRVKRLLVVNPNSSGAVSQRLREVAEVCLAGRAAVHVETAVGGPSYLGDLDTMRAGEAAAIATARNLCIDRGETFDAVVMGCFAELGVIPLRQMLGLSVCSLLGASLLAANRHGRRLGIVTAGAQWRSLLPPMVEPLLQQSDMALAGIRTIDTTGTTIAEQPDLAIQALNRAVWECRHHDGADVIVIGGAGLGGLAARLDTPADTAVIDSVEAALMQGLQD
jgi:Asp/Glu/hydantoin racemase